jgi:hypothetical protein
MLHRGKRRTPPSPSAINWNHPEGSHRPESNQRNSKTSCRTGYACGSRTAQVRPPLLDDGKGSIGRSQQQCGPRQKYTKDALSGSGLPCSCRTNNNKQGGRGKWKRIGSESATENKGAGRRPRQQQQKCVLISRVLGSQKERRATANISDSERVC